MDRKFQVGERVRVKDTVPGGTNRTPFFIRGKKGVVVYYHGPARNPSDLSYGGRGQPELPLFGVSFHMAHVYDEDPDFLHDRLIVDVLEDWLDPVTAEQPDPRPIDREEHGQSYYDSRSVALGNLLVKKGVLNTDEMRRVIAEANFKETGANHPMVSPP